VTRHRLLAALGAAASLAGAPSTLGAQLPAPPVPPENPITAEKAVLGKILFWDEQLSSDNTVACGTCHIPAAGGSEPRTGPGIVHPGADQSFGTADDVFGSPGVMRTDVDGRYEPDPLFGWEVQRTGRHSQDFLLGAWFDENFWDGRASGTFVSPDDGLVAIASGGALESQSMGPPVSAVEMGHIGRTWDEITAKLAGVRPLALARDLPADVATALTAHPSYPDLFAAAFGSPELTARRVAFAIATYERTLVPDQTPFDLFMDGDIDALTPQQTDGLFTFELEGECSSCHLLFFDFEETQYRNIGLRPNAEDPGRQAVTGNPADAGKFKVPLLWNVGLRERFFHNGQMASLDDVVDFYDRGGDFHVNQDLFIRPLGLTAQEKADIVEFLANGLTDPRVAAELPPFDRPTLYSERGSPNTDLIDTSVPGSGGFAPTMLARTPPVARTPGFRLGVANALGGARAILMVGVIARPTPGGGPAAQGLGLVGGGRPGGVLFGPRAVAEITLDGAGPGGGYGTLLLPAPSWVRLQAFWMVEDPAAPGGFAISETADLRFF